MSKDNETVEETTEEQTTDTSNTEINILDMSEDELDNLDIDALEAQASSDEKPGSDDSDTSVDSDSTTQDDEDEEDATSDDDPFEESEDDDSDEQSADDVDEDTDGSDSSEDSDSDEDEGDSEDDEPKSEAEIELAKILAPFKANGKDIQVDNVDDAITLMKMGANYNKKMSVLKPNLKLIKKLENNDLLDDGKLNFLIDLNNKNPEAIKKLIKDSGIDPLTVDVKEDTGYEPETYNVDDSEVELDLVLSDLKDGPKFKETMDIISNKLDAPSRKVLVDSPDIIRVLNEHVELGIYDKIATVVERERMLGKLTGLNDLQAYKQVSDAINANAAANKQAANSTSSEKTDKPKAEATEQKQKTKARKKSAAATTSAPGKKVSTDVDLLNMSDEDIENFPISKYM